MKLNWLARARAVKKRRRERLLAAVHEKVQRHRERNPLPQMQLELDDRPLSRREWLERVKQRVFGDPAVHP